MGPNNRHEITYVTKVEGRIFDFYATEILEVKKYGIAIVSELEGNQIRIDWFDSDINTPDLLKIYNQLTSLKHGFSVKAFMYMHGSDNNVIIKDITWRLDFAVSEAKKIKNAFPV